MDGSPNWQSTQSNGWPGGVLLETARRLNERVLALLTKVAQASEDGLDLHQGRRFVGCGRIRASGRWDARHAVPWCSSISIFSALGGGAGWSTRTRREDLGKRQGVGFTPTRPYRSHAIF